jgi:hypothetical protein
MRNYYISVLLPFVPLTSSCKYPVISLWVEKLSYIKTANHIFYPEPSGATLMNLLLNNTAVLYFCILYKFLFSIVLVASVNNTVPRRDSGSRSSKRQRCRTLSPSGTELFIFDVLDDCLRDSADTLSLAIDYIGAWESSLDKVRACSASEHSLYRNSPIVGIRVFVNSRLIPEVSVSRLFSSVEWHLDQKRGQSLLSRSFLNQSWWLPGRWLPKALLPLSVELNFRSLLTCNTRVSI